MELICLHRLNSTLSSFTCCIVVIFLLFRRLVLATVITPRVQTFLTHAKLTTRTFVGSVVRNGVRESTCHLRVCGIVAALFKILTSAFCAAILQCTMSAIRATILTLHGTRVTNVVVSELIAVRHAHANPSRSVELGKSILSLG